VKKSSSFFYNSLTRFLHIPSFLLTTQPLAVLRFVLFPYVHLKSKEKNRY
jgi:hypothetical protein